MWSSQPNDTYSIWSRPDLLTGTWIEEGTVRCHGADTPWIDAAAHGLDLCWGTIHNNTIQGNSAEDGEGGGLCDCPGKIQNCIIWGNIAQTGAHLYGGSTPRFSCIQEWSGGGVGNISLCPCFANAPYRYDLLSQSPCIDAGWNEDWM
jgi:hypothetical protein